MNVPSLECEMKGLSFAAKAVLATATALTYECQETEIAVRIIKRMLSLSDEAWEQVYAELYEAGALYRVPDQYGDLDLIEVNDCSRLLSFAIGPGGRPSPKDWAELRVRVFEHHGAACIYCGSTDNLAVDHFVPISRGGSNHFSNLVPACKRCNSAKGGKSWEEWNPEVAALRP